MQPVSTVPLADVLKLVEQVARSVGRARYMALEDLDDFAQTVYLKIAADDYHVLRQFEGRSSLRTYLTVVTVRVLKDWQNHRYGKWRPSAASERLGQVAVTLDQLINRDGVAATEAVRTVATRNGLSEREVGQVADQVPRRPKRQMVSLEAADTCTSDFVDPVALDERHRRSAVARSLLARALAELPREDARLMVLRFVRGHAVSDLARRHRLDPKGLYRRFERVRRDLRERLQTEGLASARVS